MNTLEMHLPLCEDNPLVAVYFEYEAAQPETWDRHGGTPAVPAYVEITAVFRSFEVKEPGSTLPVGYMAFDIFGMLHPAQREAIEAHILKVRDEA